MDFKSPNTGNNHTITPGVGNFLESLRAQSPVRQNETKPMGSIPSFEAFQEKRRLEQARREQFFQTRVKEFNEVYSHSKQEEVKKIEEIRQKLQRLAKSVEKFNQEVYITASQKVVDPGKYHLSLFDQLLVLVELMQKNIDDSRTWLQLYQTRGKKKGYFWDTTDTLGTKFMGSNERNVATSVG